MPIELASEPSISAVQRQMQRVMEQMQKGFFNFCPSETWTPNVNLYETETAYQVCVDLAGVDKEKIDIEVIDHRLSVKGTRAVPIVSKQAEGPGNGRTRVHLMEIDHGSFARLVELPHDVAADRISAEHRNGILWIEIPKK